MDPNRCSHHSEFEWSWELWQLRGCPYPSNLQKHSLSIRYILASYLGHFFFYGVEILFCWRNSIFFTQLNEFTTKHSILFSSSFFFLYFSTIYITTLAQTHTLLYAYILASLSYTGRSESNSSNLSTQNYYRHKEQNNTVRLSNHHWPYILSAMTKSQQQAALENPSLRNLLLMLGQDARDRCWWYYSRGFILPTTTTHFFFLFTDNSWAALRRANKSKVCHWVPPCGK